jgi:hypothetical protein
MVKQQQLTFVAPVELVERVRADAQRAERNVSTQLRLLVRDYYKMIDGADRPAQPAHAA